MRNKCDPIFQLISTLSIHLRRDIESRPVTAEVPKEDFKWVIQIYLL